MFINDFKICCIEDSKITEDMINKIIRIKQYYWDYSYEEHKKWIQKNIDDDEYHLSILSANDEVIAYLTIIKTYITNNSIKEEVIGVGNVCVNKNYSGQGIGQLLMSICNYYLDSFDKRAMLLCKAQLIKFYEKTGWSKHEGEVYLKGIKFQDELMFNRPLINSKILIERNF